jgi:hypothetical protein
LLYAHNKLSQILIALSSLEAVPIWLTALKKSLVEVVLCFEDPLAIELIAEVLSLILAFVAELFPAHSLLNSLAEVALILGTLGS